MPAEFRRAHGAPGDAVARNIEATDRARESMRVRQEIFLRYDRAVEHDLAGDRGAQRQFSLDLGRGEALGAPFDDEAAHLSVKLRPHHREVGDRSIADPHF